MKAFAIYSLLRFSLFVTTYAVVALLWVLIFGRDGMLLLPFLVALIISSVLSMRLLAPQRERLAGVVEARAQRATQRFEERRAREDTD